MTRSRSEGAKWAKGKVGTYGYGGMCLQFTREAFAIPSKYGYAREAWQKAKHRHPLSGTSTSGVPTGVPLFLDKSSSEYGHVVVFVGSGQVVSTHASTNRISQDTVSEWVHTNGYHLLGWTEDLNGVLIPGGGSSGGGGSGDLKIDGIWGSGTTKRIQQVLKTQYKDGEVSRQNSDWKKDNPGLTSGWEWMSSGYGKGSDTIRAIQGKVGASKDGLIGPGTIKKMQSHFGTTVDGHVDHPSSMVKAMQKRLNAGKF